MKSLQEDIKNQEFKKVYLLCGEEDYLKKQYKEKLKTALVPDGDTMNFSASPSLSVLGLFRVNLCCINLITKICQGSLTTSNCTFGTIRNSR